MCRPPKWVAAAESFLDGNIYLRAAQCYDRAWMSEQALAVCYEGGELEYGLKLIEEWEGEVARAKRSKADLNAEGMGGSKYGQEDGYGTLRGGDWDGPVAWKARGEDVESIKEQYVKKCAAFYWANKQGEKMMAFVRKFSSVESQWKFLNVRDCLDELIEIEERCGNLRPAAEARRKKGDHIGAANAFVGCGDVSAAWECWMLFARLKLFWVEGHSGWSPREGGVSKVEEMARVVPEEMKADSKRWAEFRWLVGIGKEMKVKEVGDRVGVIIEGRRDIEVEVESLRRSLEGESGQEIDCSKGRGWEKGLLKAWQKWSCGVKMVLRALWRLQMGKDGREEWVWLDSCFRHMCVSQGRSRQ